MLNLTRSGFQVEIWNDTVCKKINFLADHLDIETEIGPQNKFIIYSFVATLKPSSANVSLIKKINAVKVRTTKLWPKMTLKFKPAAVFNFLNLDCHFTLFQKQHFYFYFHFWCNAQARWRLLLFPLQAIKLLPDLNFLPHIFYFHLVRVWPLSHTWSDSRIGLTWRLLKMHLMQLWRSSVSYLVAPAVQKYLRPNPT